MAAAPGTIKSFFNVKFLIHENFCNIAEKALTPSVVAKKGVVLVKIIKLKDLINNLIFYLGGKVGADAYGTMQIADPNALSPSKRVGKAAASTV